MAKKNVKNSKNNKKANIKNKAAKEKKVAKKSSTKKPTPATKKAVKAVKKVDKKSAIKSKKEIKKPVPKKASAKTITNKNEKKIPKTLKPSKASDEKEVKPVKVVTPPSKTKEKENKNITKNFKAGDYAVYPSHGVGKILDVETFSLSDGTKVTSLTMYFDKEKLTIKIPLSQIDKIGLRPLVSKAQMDEVFSILRSGVKKLKGMWSRRAQEYESKINSGDIILLAEVLRDLTRDIEDGERSYSERIIYETAIYRLAIEYAVIAGIPFEEAREKIISTAKNKLGISAEASAKPKDDFDDEFDSEESEDEEGDEDDDEDGDDEEDEDDDE